MRLAALAFFSTTPLASFSYWLRPTGLAFAPLIPRLVFPSDPRRGKQKNELVPSFKREFGLALGTYTLAADAIAKLSAV